MQAIPLNRADGGQDNAALSKVIERNIRTLVDLRSKASHEQSSQDRAADSIPSLSGSMVVTRSDARIEFERAASLTRNSRERTLLLGRARAADSTSTSA